jgi:competence protein ComEC
MFRWIPYAMVRITAFFIAGILAGIYWPDELSEYNAALIFAVLLLSYFLAVLLLRGSSALKAVSGLTGLMAVFLAGYIHLLNSTDARRPSHITHINKPIDYYFAEVTGAPEEKNNSVRVEVEIKEIKSGPEWESVTGKCLLYVSKKSGPFPIQYGDRILIAGAPMEVPPPANPGEFDFKRFLSFRNISHQQFVKSNQIKGVVHANRHGVMFYSQQVRAWASLEIQRFIPGPQNQAIARALVLGVTEGIDNDLQAAYAASGAMHILSVSGLHVGIIYGIILFLLRPLSHHSWSRWLIAFLSLICLWAYAFVTGLSPSVLRAVTMFSFIAIGRPFARDTNIYNTLAASAFLLLLYNPYLVMSVGFQLSYLAVVGIVYLQRPLYRLWEPASLFWDKVWQVTCVSLAAQLATFSLGFYYFHQFPVYFLFSNLVVIPLSSLVLVMGVLLLAVSPVPWLAGFLGLLLHYTISLLNGIVFFVKALPFSLINGVNITAVQCLLLIGMIVFAIRLVESRKFHYAVGGFVLLMVFTCIQWRNLLKDKDHDQLIVYSVPGHGALEWIKASQSYFYSDSVLTNDEDQLRFHIWPSRMLSGVTDSHLIVSDPHFIKSLTGFRFFLLGKTTVLWIDQRHYELPQNGTADYLIIGNDAVGSLEQLQNKISFRKLILDSSNSRSYASRMVNEAGSKNIKVHAVVNEGAFVVNL